MSRLPAIECRKAESFDLQSLTEPLRRVHGGERLRMANTCTVCRHKDRAKIDAALARGESLRHIASQYSAGYKSVQRHQECIAELLEAARKAADIDMARNIDRELGRASALANKMLDACDAYLTDPADHNRYTLDPRAEQVQIVYTVPGARGKAIRKKDRLSTLIVRTRLRSG